METTTTQRDPRIDPRTGDILRKWNRDFTVVSNSQGLVTSLWDQIIGQPQGILHFREFAKNAEVVHCEPQPDSPTFVCEYCADECGRAERYPGTKTCTACARQLLNGRND